ncbi:MAG: patatin-like phospholipase family protein, partial [Rhodospirillales bacterium]|nr:patatin-like phospholipase family protein [Rhodospirillales bacterium]
MPNDPAPKAADAAPLLDAEGVRREELERAVAPRRAAWADLKVDIDADVSRLAARLASLGERLAMEDLETARHKAAASDGMVPAAVDAPPPAAAPTGGGPPESAATKPPAAEPVGPAAPARSLFGLALSGGGIRSASFCLGATQALNKHDHLQTADYISSVSGGGYTNGCLAANWHRPDGTVDSSWRFPFAHQRGDIEGPALRHLRAYSNFIAPRGGFQLLHAVTQFLRGVLLNLMALLPWLLFFAGLVHALLVAPPYWCVARWDACAALALGPLKDVALAASLFVLGFALLSRQYRLFLERYAQATGRPFWDGRELFRQHVAIGACAVVATVFVAAQPYLYYALGATLVEKRSLASIGGLAAALALLTKVGSLPAVVRKGAAVVAAALAGPVLLWLGAVGVAKLLEDQGFQEFVKPVVGRLIGDGIPDGSWLFALRIFAASTAASVLLALLIWLLTLYNANEVSPHSFYRDRLSKAFMFGVVNGDRTE